VPYRTEDLRRRPQIVDISTQPYSPIYRDRVIDLQTSLWSDDPRTNDEHFRWKYEENPHDPDPIVVLAVAGDRVVGMRAAFGLGWKAGGVVLRALGDAVVAEDHRGRGVLKAVDHELMRRAKSSGDGVLMNASAGGAVRRHSLATGWALVSEIETLQWVLRKSLVGRARDRIARPKSVGAVTSALETLDGAALEADARDTGEGGATVRIESSARSEEMADVVRQWGTHGRVAEDRHAAHLAWRFSNPLCEYRFVYHFEDDSGRLTGYVVVQEHGARHDTGVNIVDYAAESDEVLRRLVGACAPVLDLAPINVWVSPARPNAVAPMRDLGFRPKPAAEAPWVDPAVLVHAEGGVARDLMSRESWDLRMTASDFY